MDELLKMLQAEAAMLCKKGGSPDFHPVLKAWVDDKSEVARVLRHLDTYTEGR